MARARVGIVGAGNVGATAAHWIVARGLADVVLVDVVDGLPQGKALDLLQATCAADAAVEVVGASRYDALRGSQVVVITAGAARRPGMSRDDLLKNNAEIVRKAAEQAVRFAPDAVVIVVTNPVDPMTWLVQRVTGLPPRRVVGMAGVLDTMRFRTFIAQALKVSVRDVHGLVLGGHGDEMVPLVRYAHVGGIPVTQLLPAPTLEQIVERTRRGGGEIVELLKTGSAFYAPGAAVAEMVEAVIYDQKRVVPAIAQLNGQYGQRGVYVGVPVVLGQEGVERIIEVALDDAERAAFERSVAAVRAAVQKLGLPWSWQLSR